VATRQTNTEADYFATYHGVKVPPGPHIVSDTMKRRISEGRYEGPEAAGVLQIVRSTDRVIECGTGLGIVGAIAALNGKPQKMISFEGNPDLIDSIKRLYALNGLEKKIELRNELLTAGPDQPKSLSFNVRRNFLGSAVSDNANRGKMVQVPTTDYEPLRKSFKPTVLIMDIEGAERNFLKHANLDGIRAVVIEFHPKIYGVDGMRECKGVLRKAGFAPIEGSTRVVWAASREI